MSSSPNAEPGGGARPPAATRLELADGVILDGVVDITHHNATERFPDRTTQVGGFVLEGGGRGLAFLRWVPARDRAYDNRWDASAETLRYVVPERSRPFVLRPLEDAMADRRPVNVLLLVGNRRYDVGTFQVVALVGGGAFADLRRRRRADGTEATTDAGAVVVAAVAAPAPAPRTEEPPPPPTADSRLEGQYRALFARWGLRVCYAQCMYRVALDEANAGGTVWYTPDGTLFDVLRSAAVRAWCGADNWYGAHCLLEIKPVYPAQDVFGKLRAVAQAFHVPVLLLYGRPEVSATEERMHYDHLGYHQGTMGILFRPGDGHSCRVHFDVDGPEDAAAPCVGLALGEVGEFGPPHPFIVEGHRALTALQQQRL